jgi:hypothetical protein
VLSRLEIRKLAHRLKLTRIDRYGEDGARQLASQLGIPVETWFNYERGVTMPAEILLKFIDLTCVNPHWLAMGQGDQFLSDQPSQSSPSSQESSHALNLYKLGPSTN